MVHWNYILASVEYYFALQFVHICNLQWPTPTLLQQVQVQRLKKKIIPEPCFIWRKIFLLVVPLLWFQMPCYIWSVCFCCISFLQILELMIHIFLPFKSCQKWFILADLSHLVRFCSGWLVVLAPLLKLMSLF